jgi:hypothetical protein
MNVVNRILKSVKSIILLPINIFSLNKSIKDLVQIENKIDFLIQRVNKLELNLKEQEFHPSNRDFIESDKLSIPSTMKYGFDNHFLQIEALLSIYNSLPNLKFMPLTRGWAGSPDFLNKIVEIILKQKPSFVLEASSGVSSVLIGLALKLNNSGKSLSLEHNTLFLEITRKNININDIEDVSTVSNCPLTDSLIDGEMWKWYETEKLTCIDKIDLLIIDGPPRTTQNLARYPAIPLLHKYFSDNVTIVLDDSKRPDEIIIVERWIEFLKKESFNVDVERYLNYEKGMVLLNVKRKI